MNILCKLLGHKWLLKDYHNKIDYMSKPYKYRRSKKCKRCGQRLVLPFNSIDWVEDAENNKVYFY